MKKPDQTPERSNKRLALRRYEVQILPVSALAAVQGASTYPSTEYDERQPAEGTDR